jgi:hypothetical protein
MHHEAAIHYFTFPYNVSCRCIVFALHVACVWIAPAPEGFQPSRNDVETLRPNVFRDRAHLERMFALLDAGAVRPPPIALFKLEEAAEAHRVSEARHLRGKLVLEIRSPARASARGAELTSLQKP